MLLQSVLSKMTAGVLDNGATDGERSSYPLRHSWMRMLKRAGSWSARFLLFAMRVHASVFGKIRGYRNVECPKGIHCIAERRRDAQCAEICAKARYQRMGAFMPSSEESMFNWADNCSRRLPGNCETVSALARCLAAVGESSGCCPNVMGSCSDLNS